MKRHSLLNTLIGSLLLVAAANLVVLIMDHEGSHLALAAPEIYASPVHAGCYLAEHDLCKIHVEPFTLNLVPGEKLVMFRLYAIPLRQSQVMIYDFRPDQSSPIPPAGSTYTPTLVKKDFAVTCGVSYQIKLEGQDTGDLVVYTLGTTDVFACPAGSYPAYLPFIEK
jgi:hypothetical protein